MELKENCQDEIEITPEMVKAGAEILWISDFDFPTDATFGEIAKRVFMAMKAQESS